MNAASLSIRPGAVVVFDDTLRGVVARVADGRTLVVLPAENAAGEGVFDRRDPSRRRAFGP